MFDFTGAHVRARTFSQDRADGINLDAERLDAEFADISASLTYVYGLAASASQAAINPADYVSTSALTALLAAKQDAIGFDPVNAAWLGMAGGVATLGTDGRVAPWQLPPSALASDVSSVNGRSGTVTIEADDITTALGFTPANATHAHIVGDVTGLQAALDGKQAALGFTPANAVHSHALADVTGLVSALAGKQALLATPAEYSASTASGTTIFPVGQIIVAVMSSPISLRAAAAIYLDGTEYTTAAAGSLLTGTWRCCGRLSGLADGLFQRTA